MPIVAANWKMNPATYDEYRTLMQAMRSRLNGIAGVERVVCPPFVWLFPAARDLDGTDIALGAQNVHWEEKGAFTGEVSPLMLKGTCRYVIVGHSERRHIFGESDEMVNRRLKGAVSHGLIPIFCVGETLAERDANDTEAVLTRQVRMGLEGIAPDPEIVIAYEPVWAIGTGRAATAATAVEAVQLIRRELAALWDADTAQAVRVQYGGSVNPDNIAEFVQEPDIDGALVGGASLNVDSFVAIVEQTARIRRGQA